MRGVEKLGNALLNAIRCFRSSIARATFGKALATAVDCILRKRSSSSDLATIHAIHFVLGNEPPAEVYVFYGTDAELVAARSSGATERFEGMLLDELVRAGVCSTVGLVSRIEFDSHEEVLRNFEGSYFLRLR